MLHPPSSIPERPWNAPLSLQGIARPFIPYVLTAYCAQTQKNDFREWHTHPFEELCLVEGGNTSFGHGGKQWDIISNTLILNHRGERHAFWNNSKKCPKLWVIHYYANSPTYAEMPYLGEAPPKRRIWKIESGQDVLFKGLFLKIFAEHTGQKKGFAMAESCWLRLLLLAINRWNENPEDHSVAVAQADPAIQKLWEMINEYKGPPAQIIHYLQDAASNYDSLRHHFRKALGYSPRQMLQEIRVMRAKHLLVETSLLIKEISSQLGFPRQHEFTRTFQKIVGISPTQWRNNPFQQKHSPLSK